MARRRNTPALFELLRDSNSTPKGQVGNPALREQIGAGTVENSAPRTPRPPDPQQKNKPDASAPLESDRVVSDAVVESKPKEPKAESIHTVAKRQTKLLLEDPAPEPTLLSEIPRYKGRAAVKPKPKPEAKPKAKPEPKANTVPKVTSERSTPTPPKPPAASKSSRPEPKIPAPPAEDSGDRAADPGSSQPNAGHITLSVSTIWMAVAAIMVVFVLVWVIAVQIGRNQSKDKFAAASSDAAKSALQDAGVTEPKIVDPLAITSDPEFSPPTVEPTHPQAEPKPEAVKSDAPAAEVAENAEQLANIDTRVPGSNYLHLAPLADPEEARRLRVFLHENGIESFVREGTKGGRPAYEIITLVGVPSKGYSTSTVKLEHEREIRRLGGLWFKEHGGSVDYSRSNQWQWYKMPASAGSE